MAHSILGDEEERNNLFNFGVGKFLHDYPGRVVDEVTAALNQIGTERQATTLPGPGTLRLATAPFAPAFQTLYRQSGNVLAPFINRLSQPSAQAFIDIQNQFAEQRGLPQREYEPLTGEQLAAPIAAAGSLLRGKFPTWFSPARRAVTTAPQQKGDLNYWLGRFKKEKGATSEAKQLGLLSTQGEATESLLSAAPGTLTKEEALSLIEPIELEETVLGRSPRVPDELNRLPEVLFSREGFVPEGPDDTKYADDDTLNLPGGENPQEILIQLPSETKREYGLYFEDGALFASGYPTLQLAQTEINEWKAQDTNLSRVRGEGYTGTLGDSLVIKAHTVVEDEGVYTGGHWDEPNVLVSLRLNERIVDGKKALHIEEIQSDWHQQGQKKGYGDTPTPLVAKNYYEITDEDWEKMTPYQQQSYADEMVESGKWKGVPDAPYKKTWHELGWKRAFMEALRDPSIESLTWTTGDVQADRYNLAKHVDEITAIKQSGAEFQEVTGSSYNKPVYRISVKYKNGRDERFDVVEEEIGKLPNYVGKEMADRIVEDADGTSKIYSGLDLEIGGEFHKQLYDQKITQFAKKFLKQFGVEPKRISSENFQHLEMIRQDTERKLLALRRISQPTPGAGLRIETLEAKLSRIDERLNQIGDLWYIDLTPEMRETYAEGVPLAMREDEEGLLGRYA